MDEAEHWVGSGIAGRVLHITPRYARRLAPQGRLPHRRTLGGQVLFSVAVLRELHAELVGAFAESFEEAVGRDPTAMGNGRPRRARPRPTLAEALPAVPRRLAWHHDATTGRSTASGPGWQASIEVADGRYQALSRIPSSPQTLKPRSTEPFQAQSAPTSRLSRPRAGPNSCEGKLFTTSAEDAARFGRINDALTPGGEPFHIVEARVPTSLANSFEYFTADGMQAVHVAEERLGALNTAGRWNIWDWVPWVGKPGAGL